ncbi:MAG: aerobic carbon-monoxide dehydrogenase large subunit [Actinomycetota bacterium]
MPVSRREISGVGHALKRREDDRFIRGEGRYVSNLDLPRMAHMAILRSPWAHARIRSIVTSRAYRLPGVIFVITGDLLARQNLAWMPTLSGDMQAVLATDKVRFQGQEVACVVAEDAYTAHDALELIEVEYEPLEAVVSPREALDERSPLIRDDKTGGDRRCCYRWEAGDRQATEAAFASAERVVTLDTHYPRSHPAPLECCACVADVDRETGKTTIHLTSQAPHLHRTILSRMTGLPEHTLRIVSPDIGGAFGNKVPIYPGYVVAVFASRLVGRPVRWVEDRTGNLVSTGYARDLHMHGELALRHDGRMLGLRVEVISDNGAFYADAQPSGCRVGLFHMVTGSYDLLAAHIRATGVYTNKAPGGVSYRCSFRVSEASFLIERLVEAAAHELDMDPAELRRKNFISPEQFPYRSPTGLLYDSGDYVKTFDLALEKAGYRELRLEQEKARYRGKLIGIGLASFTEAVGVGPSRDYDLAGIKTFDSAELTISPTGKALLKLGAHSQGQGHETTFAQIVAHELGITPDQVAVQHGDSDISPYGLGTFGSRSIPTAGAATALACRTIREKGRRIAAHLLEVEAEDLDWEPGRFFIRGDPGALRARDVSIEEVALAAYGNPPEDLEPGLTHTSYYDPPNLSFPFGAYVVVVEVGMQTGEWKVRRVVAVDDCGVRINPMIVEGQIMGGLTEGFAIASMQLIDFDAHGNCHGSNLAEYLIPTSWETPAFELYATETPCPHHPLGAKGIGESATVGSPAAFANAVIDALAHLGVRNIDLPLTPDKVWEAIQGTRDSPER